MSAFTGGGGRRSKRIHLRDKPNEVKFDCLLNEVPNRLYPAKFVSHVEKLYNTVDTNLFLDNLDRISICNNNSVFLLND